MLFSILICNKLSVFKISKIRQFTSQVGVERVSFSSEISSLEEEILWSNLMLLTPQ